MANLLALGDGVNFNQLVPSNHYDEQHFVVIAALAGKVDQTPLSSFPRLASSGVTAAALQVMPQQEIMLISSTGALVRTAVDEISVQGRNTQGVRLIRLGEGERLAGIGRVESLDTGEEEAAAERELQAGAGEPAADT